MKLTIILQVLSAAAHSLSFIADQQPKNETEKQLFELMRTYHTSMGWGFAPSTEELFIALSACFPLLYMFGALQNWFLLRKKADVSLVRGLTGISVLVFGVSFIIMLKFTFPPPIICTGLVFVSLLITYLTIPKKQN